MDRLEQSSIPDWILLPLEPPVISLKLENSLHLYLCQKYLVYCSQLHRCNSADSSYYCYSPLYRQNSSAEHSESRNGDPSGCFKKIKKGEMPGAIMGGPARDDVMKKRAGKAVWDKGPSKLA